MSGLNGWHHLAAAAAGTRTQDRPHPPSQGSQQQHLSSEGPFPASVEALDQAESEERAAELQSLLLGVSFEDLGGGASDTDDENTHAAESPSPSGRARSLYARRDADSSTLTGQCSREPSHFAVDDISSDDDDHQDGDYGDDFHDDSHDAVGPEDPCDLSAPCGDDAHMASAEGSLSMPSELLFTKEPADGVSSSGGGVEGRPPQGDIYVHHEPSVDGLIPQRLPSDPAEVQAVFSQVCVTLRTSEVQRRHLALQVQALKHEQTRLVGQLQGLAKHERELEEHVLLLSQAVAGAGGRGQTSTLQLLRGQMLDAARGEVERVRGEMQEAMKAREKAVEEMEERGREAAAVAEALKTEVGRLAEQLAQRTVVHSAHEREAKDRRARMERQTEMIDSLEQQMETLRAELDQAERQRQAAEQERSAAEAHAESEREVARGLEERLGAMEVDLAEARNRVRDLEAGLEAERRAGGGREAEGRYAAEVDRITQGFHVERSRLEAENEALRQEVGLLREACHYTGAPDVGGGGHDVSAGGGDMGPEMSPHPARRQDDEPEGPPADAEPTNDMSQFIEDGAESIDGRSEAASVWRGRCERAENECRALRAALHDVQCRMEEETRAAPEQAGGGGDASTVVERLVMERQRMADAFREELSGVLAGARRAFEQRKAAEIEETVREYEAEKLRAERARTRAVEECRVRWEEERDMLVQQWKGRIADVEEGAAMMVERRMQQVRAEMEMELRQAIDKAQREASEDVERIKEELAQTSQAARKSVEDVREELASAVREAHRLKGELAEATARKDELETMLQDLQSTHAEQIKQMLAAREAELHDAFARVKQEEAARLQYENEVTAMKAMLEASGSGASVAPAKEQGSVTADDQQAEISRLMDEKKKILAAFEEQMKRLLGEARDAMERERREGVQEGRREAAERVAELTAALEDSRADVEALRIRLKDRFQHSEAGAEIDDESMRLREEVDTLRAVLRDADCHAAELEMARARSEDKFRSEAVRLKEEHKAEVVRLRQVLKAEAEQAVARALAQAHEAFSKEKENLLGTAEEEWKERLADISRKTRLLQGAVVRMGQKARDKEAATEAVRRELSEARAMGEALHATHLEEVEKMQKDAQIREKRMKDLEKVIHKLRKHGGEKGQQREKENQENAQLVLRTELEAQERRLRSDFQHQLQEAIARSRADRDQEVEVVMSAMRKRYKGKLAKLQAQWAKERDALLAATDAVATTKLAYKPLALYNRQQPSVLRTMNY